MVARRTRKPSQYKIMGKAGGRRVVYGSGRGVAGE
jgi:hypothetical protein